MDLETLKALVLEALDEIKAEEVVTLDVQGQTDIADLMVVASGQSKRKLRRSPPMWSSMPKRLAVAHWALREEDGEWVLVDLGDIIVHLMQPEVRALYDLERLWSLSPGQIGHRRMKIELIAAGTKPPGWVREGFDTYQGRMKGDCELS